MLIFPPLKTLLHRGLREIDTESPDVEAIEESGEALAETRQALVHKLKVHEVGFQVGHAVSQLGELGF